MATRNFWLQNANRYFVAVGPSEDETYCEQFWFIDLLDSLVEMSTSIGFSTMDGNIYDAYLRKIGRRCEGIALRCAISAEYTDPFGGNWFVELTPVLRAGYYSGAVLDFDIRFVGPDGDELLNECVTPNNITEAVSDYINGLDEEDHDGITPQQRIEILGCACDIVVRVIRKFYEFAEASGLEELILMGILGDGTDHYISKDALAKKVANIKEAIRKRKEANHEPTT